MHSQATQKPPQPLTSTKNLSPTELRFRRLESIVAQMGGAVLASAETVERMAKRVDALATQVQHQGHQIQQQGEQIQQQGYQVFALSEAVQNLVDHQAESKVQLNQLTNTLQGLVALLAELPQE